MNMRILNSAEAALEATRLLLRHDPGFIVIGEGVPDPKACFGTTRGLKKKFPDRVFDTPISENGMTGVCVGLALNGFRPLHIHMRADFLLYAMDQIVNNAAKWHSMFGGAKSVPMVIKAFIGKGWGSGHQHSQNLESMFAHVPGLKVVCPSNPKNTKGLMIAASRDPNPVLILEHRWIHHLKGEVPKGLYATQIGRAETVQVGSECLVITWGAMVSEAIRASKLIAPMSVEILDLVSLRPIDEAAIVRATSRHRRVLILCESWGFCGIASELYSMIVRNGFEGELSTMALPDCYPSSSPAITKEYYPNHVSIAERISMSKIHGAKDIPHDIPDMSFAGPF